MENREGAASERGCEGTGPAAMFIGRLVGALGILAGLAGAISALWPPPWRTRCHLLLWG